MIRDLSEPLPILFDKQNKIGSGFLSTQTPGATSGGGVFDNKPTGLNQALGTGFGTTAAVTPFGAPATTNADTGSLFAAQNTQNKPGQFSNFGNYTVVKFILYISSCLLMIQIGSFSVHEPYIISSSFFVVIFALYVLMSHS